MRRVMVLRCGEVEDGRAYVGVDEEGVGGEEGRR